MSKQPPSKSRSFLTSCRAWTQGTLRHLVLPPVSWVGPGSGRHGGYSPQGPDTYGSNAPSTTTDPPTLVYLPSSSLSTTTLFSPRVRTKVRLRKRILLEFPPTLRKEGSHNEDHLFRTISTRLETTPFSVLVIESPGHKEGELPSRKRRGPTRRKTRSW